VQEDRLILPRRVGAHRDFVYDAHYRLVRTTGRVHQALLEHDYVPGTGGTIKGTRHLSFNNGNALERFTQHFDYDASGNLREIRHVGETRSWTTAMWVSPVSIRSLPALDPSGIPVQAPETKFDAAGNLRGLAHLRELTWSWRGTLARAVVIHRAGGTDDDEVYTYGADRMRVRKVATRVVHGGQVETIEKVYLDGCERKRVTRGGTVVLERWTSHFAVGDRRVALLHRWVRDDLGRETDDVAQHRIHFQIGTHQGSSAFEVDADGNVISYEEYFAHGGTAFVADDAVREVEYKDYRYSGKERDDATILYYYGHRYYAPWIRRWLSPDPIGPEDDLNLYQFVLGDPVGNVDPDGLDTLEPGDIRQIRREPTKLEGTTEQKIQQYRARLSPRSQAGFDNLSGEEQELLVTKPGHVLVPRDPSNVALTTDWTVLSRADWEGRWLPLRQEAAKKAGEFVDVTIRTSNPATLPTAGGGVAASTDSADEPGGGDGAASDAPAPTGEPGGLDGAGEDDPPGTGDGGEHEGEEQGQGDGAGEDGDSPSGTGSGIGTRHPEHSDDPQGHILGLRGGRGDGIVGGTPHADGSTPGGQGPNGLPDPTGLGEDPTGTGDRGAGKSTDGKVPGTRPSSGNGAPGGSEGDGKGRGRRGRDPSPGGAGDQYGRNGDGRRSRPGGSPDGGRDESWLTSATRIAAAFNLQSGAGAEGGSETGTPGGALGWFDLGRVGQLLYLAATVVDILTLKQFFTAIGGMFKALLRGLALFRMGIRGLLRGAAAWLRSARYLTASRILTGSSTADARSWRRLARPQIPRCPRR
jgi:RHS repeat-associated protein